MINSVKLNDRGQRFVDAEFALERRAARRAALAITVLRARCVGPRQGTPGRRRRDREGHDLGSARLALVGDLRRRRRRRSRHRDQRVQRRADGAHQQPDARRRTVHYVEVALTGTTSNRNGLGAVVKVTAGGSDLHAGDGRQLRLPVAQRVSALLRAGRRPTSVDRIEVAWPSGKRQTVPARDQLADRRARAVGAGPDETRTLPARSAGSGWGRLRQPASGPRAASEPAGSRRRRTAARCGTNCASNCGSGAASVLAPRVIVPRRSSMSPWMKQPFTPAPSSMSIS